MTDITVCYKDETILLPTNKNGNLSLICLKQHYPEAEGLIYEDSKRQRHVLAITLGEIIINSEIKTYHIYISEDDSHITNLTESKLHIKVDQNSDEEKLQHIINTETDVLSGRYLVSRNCVKTLRVGWLHKSNKSKKYCKMKRPLGGVKKLKLDKTLNYTANEIKDIAVREFMSDKHCAREDLFCIHLGFSNGQIITDFQKPNGQICDIWDYCKANVTTPYKLNLFILTSPKDEIDIINEDCSKVGETNKSSREVTSVALINNIRIIYYYVKTSKYSNEIIYTECEKANLYTYFLEDHFGDGPPIEEFEPLDNGYMISRIEKNGNVYFQIHLDENLTKSFNFPMIETLPKDSHTIIYDVDEIQGLCNKKFGIGVIPSCTDACRPIFTWYKDGKLHRKSEYLYWLNDVLALMDDIKHTWSCSIYCKKSDRELISKSITIDVNEMTAE